MHCFGYSLVTSTVCAELDPGAHMGCIRLPFLNQVWHMLFQCTKRPSRVEVIIKPSSPRRPAAPRRAVASSFPIWSKKSKSFSNVERDSELLASWGSVAELRGPSRDRLCKSSDWSESDLSVVVAARGGVALKMDSFSIFLAEPWVNKSSRSSTNSLSSLWKLAARVFGFMTSMVSRRKSPVPSATQTHELKTSVVPSGSTALVNLNDAIEFAGGSSMRIPTWRQLSVFYRCPPRGIPEVVSFR
jgi:hypothetical protein